MNVKFYVLEGSLAESEFDLPLTTQQQLLATSLYVARLRQPTSELQPPSARHTT